MKIKSNDNLFFGIMGFLFGAVVLAYIILLFQYVSVPSARMMLLIPFVLVFVLALIWAFYLRRKISLFAEDITSTLDQMLADEEIVFSQYADTLTTKVKEKLKQFYNIIISEKEESVRIRREVQEIVSDISHQVKTPIANVRMFTGILQQREMKVEKRNEFLGQMEKQINKLDFLMESMIKMSRLEIGILNFSGEKTKIIDIIAGAMDGVWVKADQKDIEMEVSCDEKIAAKSDKKWTTEAIFNILDNAVKYTPGGGKVRIEVIPWHYYTRIDICDNGKGIETSRYTDIFKRFYREPEVAAEEGVGLGLHLAREIVTQQKGYISVKSKVGKGTTFSVYLLS